MKLSEYLDALPHGTAMRMAKDTDVSYTTIAKARGGMSIQSYPIAKAISDWTGGVVTIKDLCEPIGAPYRKRGYQGPQGHKLAPEAD